jgi:hypothetical protein
MSEVVCNCGKKFQIEESGKGYEEFRQHLREEDRQITASQWMEAADRIEKTKETAKSKERATGAKDR